LEHAKKELAQAEHELDVTQRKAALDSDAYYSKPDFANDKDGKANLDAEAQQISEKKQAVETLKARVAELQALVGEAPSLEPDKNPPNN
jgi:multidrug resistance efflux pump